MGCFSSSPSTAPTTQVVTQTLPAYIEEASKKNLQIADEIGSKPYTPYPAERIAGFTPDTQSSFSMTRDAVGSWKPDFMAATGSTRDMLATPTGAAGIGQYINPYLELALKPSLDEIGRQADIRNVNIGRRANAAAAYGGSRHGVVQAENERNTRELIADTIGKHMATGYDTAANLYGQDRNQRLQAAQILANLTGSGQSMELRDAAALAEVGGTQQAMEQAKLTRAYQDFLEQRDYPIELLNIRSAALGNAPYARTTTQQGETLLPNTTAQNLGALAAMTGAGAMLSNSGAGKWIGNQASNIWNMIGV